MSLPRGFHSRPLYPQRSEAQASFGTLILVALVLLSVFSYIGAYAQEIGSAQPQIQQYHAVSSRW
jgi:hypothetical protein